MAEIIITAILTSASVSGICAYLGKAWLEKHLLKQKNNYDTKLKEIQSDLDKKNHVHRVQFEKEFQIYQEIWELVVKIQKSIFLLNSCDDEDRKADLLEAINENHNCFFDYYHGNKPFYPEEIHKSLNKIFGSSIKDALKHDQQLTENDFVNLHKINSEVDNCAEMIRKRINLIQVSE